MCRGSEWGNGCAEGVGWGGGGGREEVFHVRNCISGFFYLFKRCAWKNAFYVQLS